jgi:peptide chain release factor 1
MGVLRARLQDREEQKQQDKVSRDRRSQVGSGERAEKIRTYNFPQDRLTDHRTGQTMHNLPRILDGEIEELLSAVAAADQAQQLEAEPV